MEPVVESIPDADVDTDMSNSTSNVNKSLSNNNRIYDTDNSMNLHMNTRTPISNPKPTDTSTHEYEGEDDMHPKAHYSTRSLLYALKVPIFVTICFFLIAIPICWAFLIRPSDTAIYHSIDTWGDCVLRNYDTNSNDNNTWISECGEHPEVRTQVNIRYLVVGIVQAQGTFIWFVYLQKTCNYFKKFYIYHFTQSKSYIY